MASQRLGQVDTRLELDGLSGCDVLRQRVGEEAALHRTTLLVEQVAAEADVAPGRVERRQPEGVADVLDAQREAHDLSRSSGEARPFRGLDPRAQASGVPAVDARGPLQEGHQVELAKAGLQAVHGEDAVVAVHQANALVARDRDGRGVGVRLRQEAIEARPARAGEEVGEVEVVLEHPEVAGLEPGVLGRRVALSRLGHRHPAAGAKDAEELPEDPVLVRHVVEGVEAHHAVDRLRLERQGLPVVGEEARGEVLALARVEKERLPAQGQRGGADVDRHRVAVEPVQERGQPAAPGAEVDDRVPDAEVEDVEDQRESVEDRRGVAHGAERLVEDVLSAGGLGRDRLPLLLGRPVELLVPPQELGLRVRGAHRAWRVRPAAGGHGGRGQPEVPKGLSNAAAAARASRRSAHGSPGRCRRSPS